MLLDVDSLRAAVLARVGMSISLGREFVATRAIEWPASFRMGLLACLLLYVRSAGVAPREFQGPYTGLSLGLYLPLALHDVIEGGPPRLEVRLARSLTLLSRLKPGSLARRPPVWSGEW